MVSVAKPPFLAPEDPPAAEAMDAEPVDKPGAKAEEERDEEPQPQKKRSRRRRAPGEKAAPATPASGRPSRERKTVERYTELPPSIKPAEILQGPGTKLKDIPNVSFKLSKRKADENLQSLHTIMFGTKSNVYYLKRNITQFSGFVWTDNQDKQRIMIKEKLGKINKEKLLDFCEILDVHVKATTKKEEVCTKLLEFLESPCISKDVLSDVKKGRRNRRMSKGSGEATAEGASEEKVPPRRSPRFAGREPEHPIVLDEASEEHKVRGKQPAITPLRRSARFHRGDKSPSKLLMEKGSYLKQLPFTANARDIAHNRKTQTIVNKDNRLENPTRSSQRIAALKASARMKTYKEPRTLLQESQGVPPRRKTADASCSMSEMQELKPSYFEELTRKRKRGTAKKPTSRKPSRQEPKSDCQTIAPIAEPRNIVHKKSENDPSSIMQPKISDDTLMNTKECNEELSGIKRRSEQRLCASDHWTEEQDLTLRQAYFAARPSPHFWKKVSKMVPGKSAEECFNRVHADLSTPTPIAPRPRTSKVQFSPLGHFTLSDTKFPNLSEPLVGRQRTARQKSLAAQKTVRHLLKKHSLIDQAQEVDHFSVFETSPSALQLNIPLEDCPGTPDNYLNSCSLHKDSMSYKARKRPLSRLKTKQDEPSPAVLKPVKNAALHEKYIDRLSRREGTKKPRKKAAGKKATGPERPVSEQQAGSGLKAVKDALISEATDFISKFKKSQANSLAHVLENTEDDEDTCSSS